MNYITRKLYEKNYNKFIKEVEYSGLKIEDEQEFKKYVLKRTIQQIKRGIIIIIVVGLLIWRNLR